tara:strand:+ start:34 stop:237 length:204 start_codon:yes stop_codon:yes gene_type:complete
MSYDGYISTLADGFTLTDGNGDEILTFHFPMELSSINKILNELEEVCGNDAMSFVTPITLKATMAGV